LTAIHVRDECVRDAEDRRDELELVPDDEPPPPPPDADIEPRLPSGAVGAETVGAEGVDSRTGGDAIGSFGVGSVGIGRTGAGGSGTVGVGTGRLSASATPAEAPSTTSTEARAADLIAGITSNPAFRVRGPRESWTVPAVKADYYELLGIPRDADEETIRRAFYAAARDYHPDISDSPDAEQRFRELAEAYSVLSKPGSRLLYDRYGYRGRGNQGFDEALWEAREQALRGESVRLDVDLRWFEAREGTRKVVEFEATSACEVCEGRGTTRSPDPECATCGGTGRTRQVSHLDLGRVLQIEACPECSGEVCPECGGTGRATQKRRLRLRIPPPIEDGTQLRVGGEGHAAANGGVPGDLLVDVHVTPKPRDPRLVRYLALALFLAAIAALIAYLFL